MKELISLDSLTDIVSNSVGILIIFAVINLIHDNNKTYQLEIPLEHATDLTPVFYLCKDDRLLAMDTNELFSNATLQASTGAAAKNRVFSLETSGLFGKIDEDNGLSFYAKDTSEWSQLSKIDRRGTKIRNSLDGIDPKKQFAYFFVYDTSEDGAGTGSGFEAFRKAREYLKNHAVKSGWQPVNNDNPANICDAGFSARCSYLPSYLSGN